MLALDPNAQVSSSVEVNQGIVEIPLEKPKPPGFDGGLWSLLQEIGATGIRLRGKIAEYAGFYFKLGTPITTEWDGTTDNGAEPDVAQTWSHQPNASLDKLTFMIMFQLPFRKKNNTFQYYGKPDDASVAYGDPANPVQSWTYRGNSLRVPPLRKLNERGEEVNDDNVRCDESGTPLDAGAGELNTPVAYHYYNDIGAELDTAVAAVVKNQPLYLYLTTITEASFDKVSEPGEVTLTLVQSPEDIVGLTGRFRKDKPAPIFRRREIELGMYVSGVFTLSGKLVSFPPYPVHGAYIAKETAGARAGEYYVMKDGPTQPVDKIYVRLKYTAEKLAQNGDHSLGATVFELDGLEVQKETGKEVYYARYYSTSQSVLPLSRLKQGFRGPGDVQFDNIAIEQRSGVTIGWGYDIGQGARADYQYKIEFKIWVYAQASQQPAGTTTFVLRYKDRSQTVALNATAEQMETALLGLLGLKATPWPGGPKTITVAKVQAGSGDADYPTRWDVSIIRTNMDPGEGSAALFSDQTGRYGFFNIYSASVFYQPDADHESKHPNIKITPALEKDRYVLNTSTSAKAAWTELMDRLNKFCGVPDWRTVALPGVSTARIKDFEDLLRSCLNVRRGNFYLPIINHYELMRKFRLPAVETLFAAWAPLFMIPGYYKPAVNQLPAELRPRLNAAEKYVLTATYYKGVVGKLGDLHDAIREKSFAKLVAVVERQNATDTYEPRRKTIIAKLETHFRRQLYRNVEEE